MKINKTLHLIVIPGLLVISAALVIAGALLPRHELYYPALLSLMSSGVLELLELSLSWRSKKGFALSLLNLMLLAGIALNHMLEGFPVIASKDWHLGITIMLLYVLDVGFYVYSFREKWSGFSPQTIRFTAIAALPLIAAGSFYLGVRAWIGLLLLTLTVAIGEIILRARMS